MRYTLHPMPLPTTISQLTPTTYLVAMADGSELSLDLMLFEPYQNHLVQQTTLQSTITAKEAEKTLLDIVLNKELYDLKLQQVRLQQLQDQFLSLLFETIDQVSQIDVKATSPLFQQAVTRLFAGNLFEVILVLDDKAIEEEAQQSEQNRMRSLSYYRLKAQTYLLVHEHQKAQVYFEKLILIYPSSLTYRWYADTLAVTDLPRAVSMYQEGLRMCSVPTEQLSFLNRMASLSIRLKQFPTAAATYQQILNLHRSLGEMMDKTAEAETVAHLADVLLAQGAQQAGLPAQAGIQTYEQALVLYDQLSGTHPGAYKVPIASISYQLGLFYTNTAQYAKAQQTLRRAYLLQQQSQQTDVSRSAYAHTAYTLARVHVALHDFGPAAEFAQQSFTIFAPLAKDNPEHYLPDFFQAVNLLAQVITATHGPKTPNPLQQYGRQIAQFLTALPKK